MQVTYAQFNALVLALLGAPVTQNNIDKLNAIAVQEGTHGTFNPMNWVTASGQPGETNYNSVGVKNYPSLSTGVIQTVKGLQQSNTSALKANLVSNGTFGDWITATNHFYGTWGGGMIGVTQQNATLANSRLLEGDTTQAAIDLTKNQIVSDVGGAVEVPLNAVFQPNPTNPLDPANFTTLPNPTNGAIGAGLSIGNPLSSVNDLISELGKTVFSGAWWKWIGLGALGVLLIFFAFQMSKTGESVTATATKAVATGAMA